jgi:iron complex transport system substrate-binding protein
MVKPVPIDRRGFCAGLLAGWATPVLPALAAEPLQVTDMAGRSVTLAAPPQRIVLLEAHDILTMALLHPDPATLVVGWAAVDRIDSDTLRDHLSTTQEIKVVGFQTPDTVSIEALASLWPDLVVASSWMAPQRENDPLVRQLASFGIPVVFSDLSSNAATGASGLHGVMEQFRDHLRMWGELLGAGKRAAAYESLVLSRLNRVSDRLSGASPAVTYLEVQSSTDSCCWAAGNRIWGELLALAGGRTLPGVTAPWFQQLSLEYLLSVPQAAYIASGGGWAAGGRPPIGPGMDPAKGRKGLERMIARPGFSALPSVAKGQVYGIWTGLITMPPLNILFIERVAKWLHPGRCADIDPDATLAEINDRFLARPIEGPLWVSLKD